MRYSVVLFDLDGTLLDTLDDLTAGINFALGQQGLPACTRAQAGTYIGNGAVAMLSRAAGEGLQSADLSRLVEDFKRFYGEHCQDKTQPYDGVIEALKALRKAGVKVGVVSNKVDFAVKLLCKQYFGELVDVAIGENEGAGVRKKPAPDSVLAAMRAFGANPQDTVYVGDSEVDIQTAKNAGIACISVTWGLKDRAFLMENGAKRLADNTEELMRFL